MIKEISSGHRHVNNSVTTSQSSNKAVELNFVTKTDRDMPKQLRSQYTMIEAHMSSCICAATCPMLLRMSIVEPAAG